MLRDDTVHALTAHFDVDFGACPQPFGFSTSPEVEYTHWKHTVFYLEQPLELTRGSKLRLSLKVARNAKNQRDIDVSIRYRAATADWTQHYTLR